MTCCMKGCSNQTRLNKNASYNKVLQEDTKFLKKNQVLYKSKITALEKSFMKIDKKQKIFFCKTVSKFQEILTLNNICNGAKQIYPKK